VAAVEVAAIADQQDVLVVSQSALIAGIVVVLGVDDKLLCLHLHLLRLLYSPALAAHQLQNALERPSAAGTGSGGLAPLLNAFETKLVLAGQTALD
jgi:hypothetical protein